MSHRQLIRAAVTLALALVLPAAPAWAETANHSGTIAAVDRTAGTIVLDEVGPWRVKDGMPEITRRTIALVSTTEFKLAKRTRETGPTGWAGDFVEMGISARDLKEGDFVTVKVLRAGERLTALKVTVVARDAVP